MAEPILTEGHVVVNSDTYSAVPDSDTGIEWPVPIDVVNAQIVVDRFGINDLNDLGAKCVVVFDQQGGDGTIIAAAPSLLPRR